MAYVLIEFGEADGSGVAVVAKKWLTPRKTEVFWPPTKEQRHYNKLVKDLTDANTETWKLYKITRHFYETDDFLTAQQKLKLSEFTSDLASDTEAGLQKKRNCKRPVRYSSSEDEDNSDQVRPPPIKHLQQEGAGYSSQVVSTNSPLRNVNIICKSVSSTSTPSYSDANTQSYSQQSFEAASIYSNGKENDSASAKDVLISTVFQKKLFSKLIAIEEQNKQILDILQTKGITGHPENHNNLLVKIPINSDEDLVTLEESLKNEDISKQFKMQISMYGGKDVSDQTYRIMKHVLSDSLASAYSFYGKRAGKKPFFSLKDLKTSIIEAVRTNCITAKERDIEDSIKAWLKHAPDRIKKIRNKTE